MGYWRMKWFDRIVDQIRYSPVRNHYLIGEGQFVKTNKGWLPVGESIRLINLHYVAEKDVTIIDSSFIVLRKQHEANTY